MLIHRRALEVVRLCEKPEEEVAPVVTHVFVDTDGRLTATNGHVCLRVKGLVKEEPNLFMAEQPGVDELSSHALPRDLVVDFLRAWEGDQVIVREDAGGTLIETVDGQTSRRFESKSTALDPPKFDSVLRPKADAHLTTLLSVEELTLLARTLKALGARSVRFSFSDKEEDAIHLIARVEGEEDAIEGALMPMRE